MLAETVTHWTREWKKEGLMEGRKEGRKEGLMEGTLIKVVPLPWSACCASVLAK